MTSSNVWTWAVTIGLGAVTACARVIPTIGPTWAMATSAAQTAGPQSTLSLSPTEVRPTSEGTPRDDVLPTLDSSDLPEALRTSRFLVVGGTNEDTDIYVLDVGTEAVALLLDNNQRDAFPSWSPAGTRIAFASEMAEGIWQLLLLDPTSSTTTPLVYPGWSMGTAGIEMNLDPGNPSGIQWLSWAPDGEKISYYATDGEQNDVIQVDMIDGSMRPLMGGNLVAGTSLSWSPDSRFIAIGATVDFRGAVRHVQIVDPAGPEVLDLDVVGYSAEVPTWHPSSNSLAYVSAKGPGGADQEIRTVDLGTRQERLLATDATLKIWLAWSPDGEALAYGNTTLKEGRLVEAGLFVIPILGGPACAIAEGIQIDPRHFAWSHDGDFLAYLVTQGDTADLMVAEVCQPGRWRVAMQVGIDQFGWDSTP